MTQNPLAEPLRRCLAALSDDYASANDPKLKTAGGVDWDWNLRIMREAQAALEAAGEKSCRIEQQFTASAIEADRAKVCDMTPGPGHVDGCPSATEAFSEVP